MISGALLLDESRNERPIYFYKKRLQRIGIPIIFWTVFYLFFRKFVGHEELTIRYIAKLILTAKPYYHLWFLFIVIGLYLVTPALRAFIRNSSFNERILIISIIFILASCYSLINILFLRNKWSIFSIFIPYIGYYLFGYQVRLIDPKKIPLKYIVAALILSAIYIAMLTGFFVDTKGTVNNEFVFDFFSPPVIIIAIAIFWAAYIADNNLKKIKQSKGTLIERVASTTFGIYVIHPVILEFMRYSFGKNVRDDNFIVGLIVAPVVAFIVCYFITSILMKIPYVRRLVS
jgi:surface polysaccharide O-acyltransferase-like enzyme